MSLKSQAAADRNMALGWIFSFTAALLWTGGTIAGKKLLEKLPSRNLTGVRMLSAGVLTLGAFCLFDGGAHIQALTARQWLLFGVKGAVCSAGAYSLYLYGLHISKVTAASALEQIAPLYTLVMSIFILHEPISGWQWFTSAIVLCGAALIIVHQWKTEAATVKNIAKGGTDGSKGQKGN